MKLESLAMRNFRCYRGDQSIDLTLPGTSNLIIVFGENMRGKTTFLQAIQWCLYGEAYDREKQRIPVYSASGAEQLISTDAVAAGDFEMQSEIRFTHDGAEYILRRRVYADGNPSIESDFISDLDLREGTQLIAEASIDQKIESILSKDVSRFFLFDGEMLGDYEKLLKSPTRETFAVRQAIEMILGVPALRVGDEFEVMASQSERSLNNLLNKRDKYRGLADEVANLDNEINSLEGEVKQYENKQQEYQNLANEAELALRQVADIEKDLTEISVLDSEAYAAKQDRDYNEQRIKTLLVTNWWLPIGGEVTRRLVELDAQISEEADHERMRRRREELRTSANDRTCALCGGKLDLSHAAKLRTELNEIELALAGVPDHGDLGSMFTRQKLYRNFQSSSATAQLRGFEENVHAARVREGDAATRSATIRERISDRARGDLVEKQRRWKMYLEEIQKLDGLVEAKSHDLDERRRLRNQKQRQMNALPDADPRLRLEALSYRLLSDCFQTAMERFRDELRVRVEDQASRIFLALTTQERYTGLRINDQYGLSILDSRGGAVPGRSAGAEQIVALSLIGGLNRSAVREGPVVMDTNFSRLDKGHRENILKFLPTLGSQIVLLVHSGELERDEDLEPLGVRVARKYDIVSVSETHSEVVAI